MADKNPPATSRARRKQAPLEVRLTLNYKFGDDPGDVVNIMDDRRIPMVNSVFENRDRIMRGFVMSLLRAGASQPKVIREVFPAIKLLKKLSRKG